MLSHGLLDIGSYGPQFTWCNSRSGSHKIRERLNKRLANGAWASLLPRALIRNLMRLSLDHSPIYYSQTGLWERVRNLSGLRAAGLETIDAGRLLRRLGRL